MGILEAIQSVSLELQNSDPEKNNLYTARILLDNLIKDYPALGFEHYIGIHASIVHDKAFESAIVKLQGPSEKESVKIFKVTAGEAVELCSEDPSRGI